VNINSIKSDENRSGFILFGALAIKKYCDTIEILNKGVDKKH
jgi:hypothetical protein